MMTSLIIIAWLLSGGIMGYIDWKISFNKTIPILPLVVAMAAGPCMLLLIIMNDRWKY